MKCRFPFSAYTATLLIFSTVSFKSMAYEVSEKSFVNSAGQAVKATCKAGDRLVKSRCDGRMDNISVPKEERRPFPFSMHRDHDILSDKIDVESQGEEALCRPKILKADQKMLLIVTATCEPSQT